MERGKISTIAGNWTQTTGSSSPWPSHYTEISRPVSKWHVSNFQKFDGVCLPCIIAISVPLLWVISEKGSNLHIYYCAIPHCMNYYLHSLYAVDSLLPKYYELEWNLFSCTDWNKYDLREVSIVYLSEALSANILFQLWIFNLILYFLHSIMIFQLLELQFTSLQDRIKNQ